MQEGKVKI